MADISHDPVEQLAREYDQRVTIFDGITGPFSKERKMRGKEARDLHENTAATLRAQAVEIERLRGERDAAVGAMVRNNQRAEDAVVENKRLRAAAQAMVDFHNGPASAKRPDVYQRRIAALAAALAGEAGE